MKQLFLLILCLCPLQVTAKEPAATQGEPQTLLGDAETDAREGRYEAALTKYVWFHEHALDTQPSLYAVRLTYALTDWYDLGQLYPPALERLKQTRDQAEKQVAEHQGDVFEAFNDMLSINELLGNEDRTVESFILLDKDAPDVARRAYHVVQPALIRSKNYTLCGRYLEPDRDFRRMVDTYTLNVTSARRRGLSYTAQHEQAKYADDRLTEDVATLIALLAVNDRKPEADSIAKQAKGVSKNADRDKVIAAALAGKFPGAKTEQ
jgi:hypothetical protein